MKKLLKNEVCGTREQYTRTLFMGEKSKSYGWEKNFFFWNVNVCLGSAKRASQTHPKYIAYGYADKGTQLIYEDSKSISNRKAKCQI